MGIRSWLAGRTERRALDTMDPLLMLLIRQEPITREQAMSIPAFAGCVRFISETAAGLPVKLYRQEGQEIVEVADDPRVALLNEDTKDVLNGWQFKQALSADILIEGGGYAYINRYRNRVESLHYVAKQHISFLPGADPINKHCGIMVAGKEYRDFEFIKATRTTKDGVRGQGILEENTLPLALAYNTLRYENGMVKTGGNRRGFLKAEKKIDDEALKKLRAAWEKFNSSDSAGMMVLNAGLDFKETSATSVEMQLNERKKTYSSDISSLFGVSQSVLSGSPSEDEYSASVKIAVLPILAAIESALDHDLLLEGEKPTHYWRFDTKELLRGSIEKRYAAYKAAIDSNVLQIDEARYMEDLKPLGLNYIKLGLQDVLYDPNTKEFFIPNMNQTGTVGANPKPTPEGGESN